MMTRWSKVFITAGAVGAFVYQADEYNGRVGRRVLRVAHTGALMTIDIKRNYPSIEDKNDPNQMKEYLEARKEVNLRTAQRMLHLCLQNGGIFTKLGQHLASLNAALPPEFTETLSRLQDQALPIPFAAARAAVEAELGGPLEKFFTEFDETPVGAASLAQVHRACTVDGREVAVKIQYPQLVQHLNWDIWTLRHTMKITEFFFKDFAFQWILPDFEKVIEKELNFCLEKENSRRVAEIFKNNNSVYIPQVHDDLSTRRLLTMEFIRGCKVSEVNKIKQMGMNTSLIANNISKIFGEMIFCHGFVHCDPHPGNLFIRACPGFKNNPQIVLLDHGLYRQLDESFRSTFCDLWKALLLKDKKLMRECGVKFGAEKYYEFFPLIFTYRSVNSASRLSEKMSTEERDKLIQQLRGLEVNDVNDFMQKLPRDMLFVFRIMNLVRSLNKELGGTSRERFMIMGQYAVKGLTLNQEVLTFADIARPWKYPSMLSYIWQYASLQVRLNLIDWFILMQRATSPTSHATMKSKDLG